MNAPLLQLRAWQWTRTCMHAGALLLLALALNADDYGRYVTAVAIAACLAPLLVSGPAVVYQHSHRAFGCTREQIATLWTRTLFVVGVPCALLVMLAMLLVARDGRGWWLWVAVGLAEIVMMGFAEMRASFEHANGRETRRLFWQAAPHALRLLAVLAVLGWGVVLTLEKWVAIALQVDGRRVLGVRCHARMHRDRGMPCGVWSVSASATARAARPIACSTTATSRSSCAWSTLRRRARSSLPSASSSWCVSRCRRRSRVLPRLLHVAPAERCLFWRRALRWPAVYAVLAGALLIGLSGLLRVFAPQFETVADALLWLCWLPLLAFARGMLGNAAIIAGRGDAFTHGLWLGAGFRVGAALVLVSPLGWRGAVAGLVIAEVATLVYLLVSARQAVVVARQVPHA